MFCFILHLERGMSRQQRLMQRDLKRENGVDLASAVMVERKMSIEKGYRRALAKAFQTHPHQVDFTQPDQAVSIINAWVSDHTGGTFFILAQTVSIWEWVVVGFYAPLYVCKTNNVFFPKYEGAVSEFLARGSLSDETRLVVLNALHFHGLWKVPFDPRLTQERMFHCANGSAVPVHMMRLTNRFNYGKHIHTGFCL